MNTRWDDINSQNSESSNKITEKSKTTDSLFSQNSYANLLNYRYILDLINSLCIALNIDKV